MFDSVLSKGKIGSVEIRNRFVMPAMGSGHSTLEGTIGEETLCYYEARAKGGFGLIISEYCAIDPHGLGALNELRIYDDQYIPGFVQLVERVHKHGAKIFLQLHHGGQWSDPKISDYPCVSASPLVWHIRDQVVHELTTQEVYDMIGRFCDAAVRAKKAGADGVELHGGHGYLIPQFMSARINKRTDEFGGDIFARSLFPRLIIRGIKERCGKDFAVGMRISADETVPGGMTVNEMCAMLKLIEKEGLDAVNVSCGLPSAYKDTGRSIGGFRAPLGLNIDLAERVKRSVHMAVIAVGRLHDPALCDAVIEDGQADFVALGRGSLADPEFPNKTAEGRTDEICPCTGCFSRCLTGPDENGVSPGASCAFNPFTGHEFEKVITPAEKARTIVVAGAGVGGLEAAWIMAKRGHKVIVLEKEDRAGGQTYTASIPPCRQRFAIAIKHYVANCRRYGVDIRYNTEATAESILKLDPDAVIVATGAAPVMPDYENDGIPVVQAVDVILGKVVPGHNCLIIGGGMVGLATADFIIPNMRQVTIVEAHPDVGEDPFTKMQYSAVLADPNVKVMTDTRVIRLTSDGAVCETPEGEITLSGYDMVIAAAGFTPVNALAEELEGKVPEIHVIGDARKVGRIADAVEEAAWLAVDI